MTQLRYAYYPGCASQHITKEAATSTRLVAEKLGIELHEMPRANCCGAGLLDDYDKTLSLALNARIFAEAESMGMDIMTSCSTCLMVMSTASRDLKNPGQLEKTNEILAKADLRYSGGVKVSQLLWVLAGDYGIDKLAKMVTRPLTGLKVAPFYGCHSLRPSDALGFDGPMKPVSLEAVIGALGAENVEFSGRTKCCGFQVDLVTQDNAVKMTGARLADGLKNGADCFVTPCPFCHVNLDNYQSMAAKKAGVKFDLPVFHLAQLVGLAMGLPHGALGLARHLVSPERLLEKNSL